MKAQSAQALLDQLKNPFDLKAVRCRVGKISKNKSSALTLFYIDSRAIQNRLDAICGIDGWTVQREETPHGVHCLISIRMPNGEWITKDDFAELTKVEPLKGGASDAFKRAAVQFGIGRYLYYVPQVWFNIDQYNNFVETTIAGETYKSPLDWFSKRLKWALPNDKLPNWEDVAQKEFTPPKDSEPDGLSKADEIVARLKELQESQS